jgi:Ca2+-transporting ATPase
LRGGFFGQSAGIQVKMITGDHAVTARAIASSMGLQQRGEVLAFTGQELAQTRDLVRQFR